MSFCKVLDRIQECCCLFVSATWFWLLKLAFSELKISELVKFCEIWCEFSEMKLLLCLWILFLKSFRLSILFCDARFWSEISFYLKVNLSLTSVFQHTLKSVWSFWSIMRCVKWCMNHSNVMNLFQFILNVSFVLFMLFSFSSALFLKLSWTIDSNSLT